MTKKDSVKAVVPNNNDWGFWKGTEVFKIVVLLDYCDEYCKLILQLFSDWQILFNLYAGQ